MAKAGKGRRAWTIFTILVLVLLGLPLVTLFVIRWRTTVAWENFRTHWEAQGEQFDLDASLPAPVPDDENLAMHPRFKDLHLEGSGAAAWFDTLDVTKIDGHQKKHPLIRRELAQTADWSTWKNLPESATEGERLAEIQKRLAPLDAGLDEVAAALADRPRCHYALDWDETFMLSTPHIFEFLKLGQGFATRANLRLATGDAAGAAEDVGSILRLATAVGSDGFLIAYLVELGLDASALNVIWDGLHRQAFSDTQLRDLDEALTAVEPLPERLLACLRVERGILLRFADQFERDPGRFGSTPGSTNMNGLRGVVMRMWMSASRLGASEDLQETVFAPHGTLVTRPDWKSFEEWGRRIEKRWTGTRRYLEAFAALATPALGRAGQKAFFLEADLANARIAIALERHRLAHGPYPATLADLVPAFLPAVPEDRINGRPIEYRLKPDGTPLLYQWGFDGDDDGGTPRRDHRHGDLVWQYSVAPGFTEADWKKRD